jgi:hypothetical protein
VVNIKETTDSKIEISYDQPGRLESKKLIVPKQQFLDACTKFADDLATAAGR